jgi:glutamine synthetase
LQIAALKKSIKDHGLTMIGVTYVDLAGAAHMKPGVSTEIDSILANGIKTARGNYALDSADQMVHGTSINISQGDLAIVPDPETFAIPSYTTGIGRFMGDLHEKGGEPSPLCTRTFYKKILEDAASKGFEPQVGFEGELHLVQREGDRVFRADSFPTHSQEGFNVHHQFFTDVVAALRSVNVRPLKAHVEGGRGQVEIDVAHQHGLKAADDSVYFKDAVKAVARRHGYIASFMPKIGHDWWGSGLHMHMSIWRSGRNLFAVGDEEDARRLGLSKLAYHFIGGLLRHLPALSAIAAPSPNSYRRILPGKWNADAVVYGPGARGAAVRIPDERGKSTRIECRFPDNSCNPYLTMGAILACGLEGIEREADPGDPLTIDLSFLSDREIRQKGFSLMPRSLSEAVVALEKDSLLRDAMGATLFDEYLRNKEQDIANVSDKVSQWEVDHYLDFY